MTDWKKAYEDSEARLLEALQRNLNLRVAAEKALHEMRHTAAPRNSFTDAVGALDAELHPKQQERPAMTDKTETIDPIHVSDTCWLYAEGEGLAVVQEERDANGGHVRTLQSVIPWKLIDKAQRDRPLRK